MSLSNITSSERLHISFFGCRNAGKSSLVNAITNQNLSVVSDIKGTTTDPVKKSMELLPIGPVVIIDTAGLDDEGELGDLRVAKTLEILGKTDIAVLVVDAAVGLNNYDRDMIKQFEERKLPYVVVYNKSDIVTPRLSPSGVQKDYPPLEGGSKSMISGWGKTALHKINPNLKINAKELRNNSTKQEKTLWKYLNKSQLGYKFRRQQPIGNYIVDFFCPTLKLIIELDGGQHNEKHNIEYDKKRTEFLNKLGYRVLRIWNNDIDNNIEGVIEYIKSSLTPPPTPLPQGEGEDSIVSKLHLPPQGEGEDSIMSKPHIPLQGEGEDSIESNPHIPLQGEGEDSIVSKLHLPLQGEGVNYLSLSAKTGEGVNELREFLGKIANENKKEKYIIRDRLHVGDIVVLVIPIDESAPKGRLILPQQNVLREILDAHATALCVQPEELKQTIAKVTPKLIITDSQVFNKVKDIVPEHILLTSFSILMANYKGKLDSLIKNAKIISELKDGDAVLISEACTHHRQCNDIGTVKFPKWIKDYTNKDINFEFTQGGEFPQDLSRYKLIIHCGGCMINEAEMTTRQKRAEANGVPMVNYGMAIAYMNGILKRALEIFN